jgi:hypothetical protein
MGGGAIGLPVLMMLWLATNSRAMAQTSAASGK